MTFQCSGLTRKNNRCKKVTYNSTGLCHIHTNSTMVTSSSHLGSIVSGSSRLESSLDSNSSQIDSNSSDNDSHYDSLYDSSESPLRGYTFMAIIDGRTYAFTDVYIPNPPPPQPSQNLKNMVDTFTVTNCVSDCIVCLETGNAIIPCCLQTFCKDCLLKWLTAHNTCPHCRQTVTV